MTGPRLPISTALVTHGRHGGGLGEPGPSGSPNRTASAQVVAALHQLIDTLTELSDSDSSGRAALAHSDLPLLLDAAEAAKLLSLSRAKVCDLANRGEIPGIRVGRAVRIPRDRLVAWIEKRTTIASTSEGIRLPNWAHVDRSNEL